MRRLKHYVTLCVAASTLTACSSISSLDLLGSLRPAQRQTPAPKPVETFPLAPSRDIVEREIPQPRVVQPPRASEPVALRPSDPDLADSGRGDRQFRAAQARALSGDKEAALRVAHMYQRGTNSVPRDERRALLWLRRASDLNSGAASYQLYLYYLGRGLDREAVRYENRAVEQGFKPPARLDPRRG